MVWSALAWGLWSLPASAASAPVYHGTDFIQVNGPNSTGSAATSETALGFMTGAGEPITFVISAWVGNGGAGATSVTGLGIDNFYYENLQKSSTHSTDWSSGVGVVQWTCGGGCLSTNTFIYNVRFSGTAYYKYFAVQKWTGVEAGDWSFLDKVESVDSDHAYATVTVPDGGAAGLSNAAWSPDPGACTAYGDTTSAECGVGWNSSAAYEGASSGSKTVGMTFIGGTWSGTSYPYTLGSETPPAGPAVTWNGDSPVQSFRADTFGGYTVSASSTASSFTPVSMTIQAVRIDALYSPHHYWYCSPVLASTCDTESFSGQVFEPGTWRFLAWGTDAGGTRYYSEIKDVTIVDGGDWAEVQQQAAQTAADKWLSFTGSSTNTAVAQQGFVTTPWDGYVGGTVNVSTSTMAALHEESANWTLTSEGLLCSGSASSTDCASKTLSQRLLDYPLISWPRGFVSAVVDAVASASSSSVTPMKVAIPAMTGPFNAGEVVLLDSASSTAGIGRWISASDFSWFRALMTGALFFQFVLGMWSRLRNFIIGLC